MRKERKWMEVRQNEWELKAGVEMNIGLRNE